MPSSAGKKKTFKDRASLAGLFGAHAGGSVSWKLFVIKDCAANPVIYTLSLHDALPIYYETPAGAAPAAAGTYYWVASYGGDANNEGVSSGCADEPVVDRKSTRLNSSHTVTWYAVVCVTFKDRASLAGLFGAHASGSVRWKLLA